MDAALTLNGAGAEEASLGTLLLSDIRDIFERRGCDEIPSAALGAMADRPWGECNRGKALTQNGLAKRLKPFGITPKMMGPESKRVSGYSVESFADAFNRYIPPTATSHPHSPNKFNYLRENAPRRRKLLRL